MMNPVLPCRLALVVSTLILTTTPVHLKRGLPESKTVDYKLAASEIEKE